MEMVNEFRSNLYLNEVELFRKLDFFFFFVYYRIGKKD